MTLLARYYGYCYLDFEFAHWLCIIIVQFLKDKDLYHALAYDRNEKVKVKKSMLYTHNIGFLSHVLIFTKLFLCYHSADLIYFHMKCSTLKCSRFTEHTYITIAMIVRVCFYKWFHSGEELQHMFVYMHVQISDSRMNNPSPCKDQMHCSNYYNVYAPQILIINMKGYSDINAIYSMIDYRLYHDLCLKAVIIVVCNTSEYVFNQLSKSLCSICIHVQCAYCLNTTYLSYKTSNRWYMYFTNQIKVQITPWIQYRSKYIKYKCIMRVFSHSVIILFMCVILHILVKYIHTHTSILFSQFSSYSYFVFYPANLPMSCTVSLFLTTNLIIYDGG